MNRIPTRKERRNAMKHHGVLKSKSKLPFNKWVEVTKETAKIGNQMYDINKEAFELSKSEQFEERELAMIEGWKNEGYSSQEIDKLREAYAILSVKDCDNYHNDKKIARNLIKQVRNNNTR
jgi:hypothetical protein